MQLPGLAAIPLLLASVVSAALTITVPPSTLLPNPNVLPAGTHATLTSLLSSPTPQQTKHGLALPHPLTAPLTRAATFVFRDLPVSHPASYLLDIRSADFIFAPYRVDVAADGSILGVWETFRGNPWDNRGQEKFAIDMASAGDVAKKGAEVVVEAKVVARRGFYEQRSKFSPLSLFKNPMILLALVALGFTFGMPKLMENMDPEMRAEFEAQSRASPISGATRSVAGGGPANNFDLAGWMAGATPRSGPGGVSASQSDTTGREGSSAARRRG